MSKKKLKDLILPIEKNTANNFENLKSICFEDIDTRYTEAHFVAHFRINPNHKAVLIKKEEAAIGIIERDSFRRHLETISKKNHQKKWGSQSHDAVSELIISDTISPDPTTLSIPMFECRTNDCVRYKKVKMECFFDRKSKPPVCLMCLEPMRRIEK